MANDLQVGFEQDGYRYIGGDPADQRSWESSKLKSGTIDSGYRYLGGDPSNQSNWEDVRNPGLIDRVKEGVKNTAAFLKASTTEDPEEIAKIVAERQRTQLPTTEAGVRVAGAIRKSADEMKGADQEIDRASAAGDLFGATRGVVNSMGVGVAATAAKSLLSEPKETLGMIAENLPNSAPGIAGGLAGGAVGAATPIPGGAIVGGVIGGTAGGYNVEKGGSLYEQIVKEAQARGIDPTDETALKALVAEKKDEFIEKAKLKGIGTAGTDAVLNAATFGLAGAAERTLVRSANQIGKRMADGTIDAATGAAQLAELEAKNAARNTLGAKVARGGAVTAAEMGGESASEYAGQKLAYGEVDPTDVVLEGLLGAGQGVGMAAGRGMINKAGQTVGLENYTDVEKAIAEASKQREVTAGDVMKAKDIGSAVDAAVQAADLDLKTSLVPELASDIDAYNAATLRAPALNPSDALELAAAKGAMERVGSLDLSQPAPIVAPASEVVAAGDKAAREVEAAGGVATPAQAAMLDRAFPGQKIYDQVVGSSEQVPTVGNQSPIITNTGRSPRETVRFDNPLQAENAEGWNRLNANRAQPAQASESVESVPTQATPVAGPSPTSVIEALQTAPALQSAEQRITLNAARQSYSADDFQLLETAAQSRFNLSAEQKIRLNALENQSVFPQNQETQGSQENQATLSAARTDEQEARLPQAELIYSPEPMGDGYRLVGTRTVNGRQMYVYADRSVTPSVTPAAVARNETTVANTETVVPEMGMNVPEMGTTVPNNGATEEKPTVQILRPASADFVGGETVGSVSKLMQDGVEHEYTVVQSGRMPGVSSVVRQLLRPFNLDVSFFTSDTLKADGFIRNDNGRRTLYVNANSRMNPIAVAFHEMFHMMRRDNPVAYQAVMNVVRRNLQENIGVRYRNYYDGMEAGPNPNFDLTEAELEEIAADLVGNSGTTPAFLSDVFKEISNIAPQGQARSIVLRLAATIEKVIKAALEVIRKAGFQTSFDTDTMVNNLEEIRAVIKQALVDYAVQQKESQAKIAMEFTRETNRVQLSPSRENTTLTENDLQFARGTMVPGATLQSQGAENAAENDTGRIRGVQPNPEQDRPGSAGDGRDRSGVDTGFGTARQGAIRVQGVHYSKQPLTFVDGNRYGSNVSRNNGAEKARLSESHDNRINRRGYFYINTGNGIRPEEGVGSYPHTTFLNNLYDPASKLIPIESYRTRDGRADMNSFESAVINAGFDGYINRTHGMAVILGNKQVPVVPSDGTAEVVPAAAEDESPRAQLAKIKSLPSGELTRERWGQVLKAVRPDLYEKIEPSGAFNGDERVYKDGLVKFSKSRGLKPEVANAVDGIKKVAASLTETERAKLRKDTGEKMVTIYKALPSSDEIAAVAYAGKAKRGWYRHSVEAIQHIFGADGWRFAALLAATSPQNSVEMNLENTLRIWANWIAAGRPTSEAEILEIMGRSVQGNKGVDSVLGAWRNNSYRALQAKSFADLVLSGPKVDSFMRNLNGDYAEVTNDAWMANYALIDQTLFSGSANKAGTEPGKGAGYLAMSAKTREAAKKLGWQPAEVQETVWSWAMSMLETMDRSDETRGAIEILDQGALTDDVINATPDFRSLFREPRYADILRNGGYGDRIESLPKPVRDQNDGDAPFPAAKMNKLLADAGLRLEFLQRQRRTNVQVSWEARPGESTGILPGMHTAPLELQQQYLADIYAAIERAGFTDKMGFSLRNTLFGPSAWEGKVLAGAQTMSRPGVVADNQGGVVVDPETRKKLELVASVLGLVLRQEGVYWHYPVYKNGKPENENGIEINFGRSLTNAEMQRLYDIISKRAGHSMWAPANTPIGVRILNFTDTPHKEFHRSVRTAVTQFARKLSGDPVQIKTFSADGDAIENDWKESPDGQGYILRISEARRPDLLEWANGQLQTEVDAVNREFSEKYGWGAATLEERAQAQEVKLSPPRFYSQLEQTVAQVPARISTQPAPQWKAWLASNASKYGVKKDEIEWSGINDYLDLRGKEKVTAQEIGQFLNLNNVKITEVVKGEPSEADIEALLNDEAGEGMTREDAIEYLKNEEDATKYGQYTLPGGENYREMLLTLPGSSRSVEEIEREWNNLPYTDPRWQELADERQRALGKGQYKSSHWGEPNVLAHIRFNDRTDADGNKVLFIEEVQSDWAQQGRSEGFANSAERKNIADKIKKSHGVEVDGSTSVRTLEQAGVSQELVDAWYSAFMQSGEVPSAPFISNTKDWVALAVKRIMLLAAQGNYDKVAFVNGQQSAERYDLSKQIDKVEYTEGGALYAWDKSGNEVMRKKMPESEVEDHIGKDLAVRLLSAEKGKYNSRSLSGVDIKVGGEGMNAFYDKIVPQVVNDVIKKLGGKPGTVTLGLPPAMKASGLSMREIRELGSMDQPGFTVTPEMRDKLQGEGLPLFSPSRQSVADAIAGHQFKQDIVNQAKYKLADIIAPGNGFNWFHKTVGTQFHKAKVNPLFKKVFDLGQQFLDDVTLFATRAEDKAADLFPRFGLSKSMLKTGLSKTDNQLIARALTDGTLENGPNPHDGVVWTDDQLRTKYGMKDTQIGYYRQARAALDQSLDDLAKSEMATHMRIAMKANITPLIRADISLADVRDMLVQALDAGISSTTNEDAVKMLQKTKTQINGIYSTTTNLKNHGYAPLMRFGNFTVTAYDDNGEVAFFQMTDTKSEASLMAKNLAGEFDRVETGKMSAEAHKLFKGITPDTLELFAKHAALPNDSLTQEYLQLAVSSRSAMKRLINRKGTTGYSLDATRTLATFLTSNARKSSSALNMYDMKQAADAIPREDGDVKDEAIKLVDYLQNPGEEAAKLRGFLFFQYLGGSIASGIVNLTQPILQTYPYLSQFGAGQAGSAMKTGTVAATHFLRGKRVGDPTLQAAMEKAKAEGLIDPQEIYQLMAASQSGAGSFLSYKLMRLWGINFGVTEIMNRTVTFAAAFKVGQTLSKEQLTKAGAKDAYSFAQGAIYETQGLYNKGNRPDWARGAVGGTIFTFKQYSISYLEFMTRLYKNDKKAFGIALAILVMASGLQGLPGADDLDDVIDTGGNWLGYATNTKKWKREFLEDVFGKEMAAFALHGVSTIPGMPIDVQARLGLGNIIPGTGLMNPTKKDKGREVAEVFGVAGGLAMSTMDTTEALARGDVRRAALSILPGAVRNVIQAGEMAATGEYRDTRSRLVQKVDGGDVIAKAIGFQPAEIAAGNRRMREVQADIDIVKTKQEEVNGKYARAIVDKDQGAMEEVRAEIRDWNQKNPDLRIKFNMSAIQQRVKQARLTKEARFIKSAPQQIRQQVREAVLAD